MIGFRLPPFRLIHAAYVTHDLERGKRRLAAMFGAKEATVYPEIEIGVPGGVATIGFAVADSNGTQVEVIQPLGGKDEVYRQALPADPDDIAFHHFATRVESEDEWQLVMDASRCHGLEIVVDGGEEYGSRYAYLDTRAQLGHMLEFMWRFRDDEGATPEFEVRRERIG
jgi:catechol 2,3-dioxygenase-like lactoylglutathione lyase family enzyme